MTRQGIRTPGPHSKVERKQKETGIDSERTSGEGRTGPHYSQRVNCNEENQKGTESVKIKDSNSVIHDQVLTDTTILYTNAQSSQQET